MYVYIQTDEKEFTVGHYRPGDQPTRSAGEFVPESEWSTTMEAARRVNYLNGGNAYPWSNLPVYSSPVGGG